MENKKSKQIPELTRSTVPQAVHPWRKLLAASWVIGFGGTAMAAFEYESPNNFLQITGLIIAGGGFFSVFVVQALAGWATLKKTKSKK